VKLLLTGFEPFGSSAVNPSEQAARAITAAGVDGAQIALAILPVDRARGPAALLAAVDAERPDAVLCLGLASGRSALSIERLAVNLLDFRIPDNAGVQVSDEPVAPGGPTAYFATLPVRAMLDAVRAAGVPAELSLSAGTFLCNQVLYALLHRLAAGGAGTRAGFIHVPALPEQAAQAGPAAPSMSLETTVAGVRAAIGALIAWRA
jgi:pyroglutamyl-peptidase